MMGDGNELSEAQAEVLTLLAEECAEVIQDISKILRHGQHSYDPTKTDAMPNIIHLCKELGDLEAAKALCNKYLYSFDESLVRSARTKKLRSIDQWLHHASAVGLFTPPTPQPRPRAPGEISDEEKYRQRITAALKGDIT